jgi:hypothetical protein
MQQLWVRLKDALVEPSQVRPGLDADLLDQDHAGIGSHYNSSSYSASPVGYDNFQAGNYEDNDTDRALYTVGVPAAVTAANANLISASFQTQEVYTSSCSESPSVSVTWIGSINKSTGWPGPNAT